MIGEIKKRVLTGVVVLCLCLVVGFYMPSGYFIIMPGAAQDVGKMITVAGGQKDSQGAFLMTTVSTRKAGLLLYLYGSLHPDADLRSQKSILAPGETLKEYLFRNREMMVDSQAIATAVALRTVGYQVELSGDGARVVGVMNDSPARGLLQQGDIIEKVDGHPVVIAQDAVQWIRALPAGDTVKLQVRRDNESLELHVPTEERDGYTQVGAWLKTQGLRAETPLAVEINAGRVMGPSAGLIFALEIIDQVSLEDLTDGRIIAGTGTVDLDGSVGPVGGISQKVLAAERAGAELFLCPVGNYVEALAAVEQMRVVPVTCLADAVRILRTDLPSGV
ncbi:MAG TPA: PDZ domain-containing protein [Firmicutes bacterium]|nr:PDZ domain-containing protein [Bacillota bacterium]